MGTQGNRQIPVLGNYLTIARTVDRLEDFNQPLVENGTKACLAVCNSIITSNLSLP